MILIYLTNDKRTPIYLSTNLQYIVPILSTILYIYNEDISYMHRYTENIEINGTIYI